MARADGAADERSDVYGMGAVLYYALTGQSPLQPVCVTDDGRPSARSLQAASEGGSIALADIVFRCLDRDPDARYQQMSQLREALRRASLELLGSR